MSQANLKNYIQTTAGHEQRNIIKMSVRKTGHGYYKKLETHHVHFIGTNKLPFKEEVKFNLNITVIDEKNFKFSGSDEILYLGAYKELIEKQIPKLILKFNDNDKPNITLFAGRGGSFIKQGLATVWIGKE